MTPETLSVAFRGLRGSFDLNASFDAPLNSVTALFGPSGSGKTSVLRAIAGLERMRGKCALGRLVFQDAINFVPANKRGIGYVFQEPSLFPHLTVRGNLTYGRKRFHGKETISFDAVVDLLGIWKLLDRATAHLSGGERQRVSLGRALLSQPRLLLLDEPLSALDRAAKDELLPYFELLHKTLEIPILLVSHDIAEVERLADYMVIMADGRVTAAGPLNEMLLSDTLPLKRARDAAAVLPAKVMGYEAGDQLSELSLGGQKLLVSGRAGPFGTTVRVRIAARDVSLAVKYPSQTTILNVLTARILAIDPLSGADANVTLAIGDTQMLARVTRRSISALGLAPGQEVFAQVKGVSLVTGPVA
jgi:molybdate transport system ATP-binding protein